MSKIIINTEFFNKSLTKYDVKEIKYIFIGLGGIIQDNKIDCSQIKDNISIESFYNLEPELRAKILKHIFKTDSVCCAWSISMTEEERKVPHHLRSNHPYPKSYVLEYTMGDKSIDLVIKEILALLQVQIDKEKKEKELLENNKSTKSTKSVKSTKTLKSTKKSDDSKNNLDDVDKSNEVKKTKKNSNSKIIIDSTDNDNEIFSESAQSVKTAKKKKKTIPPALKIKVWNKHIGEEVGKTKCLCCKLKDIYQASFSCGYIISEFNGGELKLDNLMPICTSYNSSMGTKNMNDYICQFGF